MEQETRLALTVLADAARSRFVELQMAIEPFLVAKADFDDCQRCLRALLAAAIDRAESGVLITAARRGDSVHVTILDDCGTAPAAIHLPERDSMPQGSTATAEYLPGQGAKVSLRLPCPQTGIMRDAERCAVAIS